MSSTTHVVCPHCLASNRLPESRLQDNPVCGKCKKSIFTRQPIELSSQSFAKHVNNSDIPVVVDFWAPWCGPCKMMAPAYSQAAAQLEPHFRFAKVNTEQERELAGHFQIRSIPTLMIFREQIIVFSQPGALPPAALESVLEKVIALDMDEVRRQIAAQEAAEGGAT